MEWKKVQFKADQKDRKNVVMKRMTGMIEEVLQEVNKGAATSKRTSRGSVGGRGSRLGFADLAGAAAKALGSRKNASGGSGSRASVAPGGGGGGGGGRKTWKSILNKKMSVAPGAKGSAGAAKAPAAAGGTAQNARDAFHDDLIHLVSNKMSVGEDGAEVPENVPAPRANHTATCVDNSPHSCFAPLEAIFFSIVHHALRSFSKTSKHSSI